LERGAIALTVAQPHHLRSCREQLVDLLAQGDMEVCRDMALLAWAHQPRPGQGASFIGPMEHQRHAAAPDDTAIDDQPQRLQGELTQQDLRIRDNLGFLCDGRVPDPSGKAFDAALRLGAIGHMGSAFGKLCTLAAYDATNKCG
jgi:hypothetical protein